MEKRTGTKNIHAVSLQMMLDKMTQYTGGSPHPGPQAILADMRRLTDSVNSLAVLAESTDPDLSVEQRQTRSMRAAAKLGAVLPTVQERLDALVASTEKGFSAAFGEHSGLVTTERAQEIRSHIKALKDPGERALFVQDLFKCGDNESLGAVVFSPAYLSGLDQTTHSRLKSQIEQARLPELVRNREIFTELNGSLRVAISVAEAAVKDFGNPRKLIDIEERAVQAKAAEKRLAESTLPSGGL